MEKIKKPLRFVLQKLRRLSSSQIIIFGFLAVILLGTLLLMTPWASRGGSTSFFDALFTATSATCVTGLAVCDTATHWSAFGQFIILALIQVGGMGVVTVAVLLSIISGKRIGIMQRRIMQDSISAPQMGGIVKLTSYIVKVTIALEVSAAVVMAPFFIKEFDFIKGIWFSLFHSVSAFCNAGFDLMGAKEPFSSLSFFASNPVINMVIMFLIIFGGIGFLTWNDLHTHKHHFRRYCMQSKVILITTAVLIVVPAVYFFLFEFNDRPLIERFFVSLFQSVTTRTAGFGTVDYSQLSEASQALMLPLMMIGGSPGSTAGGMKTTTFAVLIISAVSVFKGRENAEAFGRRIDSKVVRNAAVILMMYLALSVIGAIIICTAENIPFLTCLFETVSAIGTVGLSLGITPTLGALSRIVLIALMFFGRVGGLTLIFAIFQHAGIASSFPLEKITVG